MIFSDKEQELYDFIKSKGKVTVKDIETALGAKSTGGIGKLIQAGEVEKKKFRDGEGYNVKSTTYYMLKETTDDTSQ